METPISKGALTSWYLFSAATWGCVLEAVAIHSVIPGCWFQWFFFLSFSHVFYPMTWEKSMVQVLPIAWPPWPIRGGYLHIRWSSTAMFFNRGYTLMVSPVSTKKEPVNYFFKLIDLLNPYVFHHAALACDGFWQFHQMTCNRGIPFHPWRLKWWGG